jgi:hypothetical protein
VQRVWGHMRRNGRVFGMEIERDRNGSETSPLTGGSVAQQPGTYQGEVTKKQAPITREYNRCRRITCSLHR